MRNFLLILIWATCVGMPAVAVSASELSQLLPTTIDGFEPPREPRTRSHPSGAEQTSTSYYAIPRSLRVQITDVGERARETLAGLRQRAEAAELTRDQWRDTPLFVHKVEMGRGVFMDAFVPMGRLVLSLRLKDSDGGTVTLDQLKAVLNSFDVTRMKAYADNTDAPRVLYDPLAQVKPRPPMDADTLAGYLPQEVTGLSRGDVKEQVHGRGRKATTAVFAPYGDSALVAIIDQGGLPAGYFPLLREGVRMGLFEETAQAEQPVFIRVAAGELPVDIEVPAALAVAGRFQVQVEIKGESLQPQLAQRIVTAVNLRGLRDLSQRLVDRATFAQHFRACEPADFIESPAYNAGYRYEILGPSEHGCQVRGRYTRNPNGELVGPTMTCIWDNTRPFDEVVENADACRGPLLEHLHG